ncbi:hypothetical protein QBC46DRAFT_154150 [Diplogelasinospora grovesii]|uniref:Uncharacterized protein n=1 Tax=Diplogelasinospora grovesii TaxID=303347 RepID=A0AAN6N5T6_9PEZI|nr:hypothetical protein QBC46DRAFT_154150 [Diplogelasinospora grovesii]
MTWPAFLSHVLSIQQARTLYCINSTLILGGIWSDGLMVNGLEWLAWLTDVLQWRHHCPILERAAFYLAAFAFSHQLAFPLITMIPRSARFAFLFSLLFRYAWSWLRPIPISHVLTSFQVWYLRSLCVREERSMVVCILGHKTVGNHSALWPIFPFDGRRPWQVRAGSG